MAIRVGVVGCGMGASHAWSYKRLEGRCQLVWVADVDEERARHLAQELGCGYLTDWEAGLDQVDAVSICTPHHLHAPQTLRALAAGKHVLVEKPMANSEAECREMAEAARRYGRRLMVAYVMRFRPGVRWVKQALEEGRYGEPINVNCWTHAYLEPRPPESWFSQRATLGGGVLFSHGCHYVDLLAWYLGDPTQVCFLGTRKGTEWLEGEGTAQTLLAFPNGTLANYQVSWGIRHSVLSGQMHLHFPEALLILHMGADRVELITRKERQTVFELRPPGERRPPGEFTQPEIEHFLTCIEEGREPETGPEEALRSLRLIWRMYAQAEAGGGAAPGRGATLGHGAVPTAG